MRFDPKDLGGYYEVYHIYFHLFCLHRQHSIIIRETYKRSLRWPKNERYQSDQNWPTEETCHRKYVWSRTPRDTSRGAYVFLQEMQEKLISLAPRAAEQSLFHAVSPYARHRKRLLAGAVFWFSSNPSWNIGYTHPAALPPHTCQRPSANGLPRAAGNRARTNSSFWPERRQGAPRF